MGTESSRVRTSDVFLEDWVTLANDCNLQIAVTLMVNGALVSGTITSGAEFLEHVGQSISAAAESDHKSLGETIEKHYHEVARKLYPQKAPSPDEDALPALEGTGPRKSYFVHLKDVTILGSRPLPTVPYWRGRLDRVDGWFIGGLRETSSK
ncbi:MAG: hypothetical protein A2Y72_01340 [Chloroflexi bacterium RBG_13_53_26]|nr:MAG: hypothetical protein A2Y72_01340 [Chloroflexi bacterium RBG_13_53_26]